MKSTGFNTPHASLLCACTETRIAWSIRKNVETLTSLVSGMTRFKADYKNFEIMYICQV